MKKVSCNIKLLNRCNYSTRHQMIKSNDIKCCRGGEEFDFLLPFRFKPNVSPHPPKPVTQEGLDSPYPRKPGRRRRSRHKSGDTLPPWCVGEEGRLDSTVPNDNPTKVRRVLRTPCPSPTSITSTERPLKLSSSVLEGRPPVSLLSSTH